jgi:hypothetical protein
VCVCGGITHTEESTAGLFRVVYTRISVNCRPAKQDAPDAAAAGQHQQEIELEGAARGLSRHSSCAVLYVSLRCITSTGIYGQEQLLVPYIYACIQQTRLQRMYTIYIIYLSCSCILICVENSIAI